MATSIKGTTDEKLEDVMRNVSDMLDATLESGLVTEVIATAMIILKENPRFQIEAAIWSAMKDWDI